MTETLTKLIAACHDVANSAGMPHTLEQALARVRDLARQYDQEDPCPVPSATSSSTNSESSSTTQNAPGSASPTTTSRTRTMTTTTRSGHQRKEPRP